MWDDEIQRIMVIVAHPDDTEFGVGGTVAKLTQAGKEVTYVICTNGDKGSSDPEMTSERLAEIREQEQRVAAQLLGVKEVVFLGYRDGELMPTLELRRDITREIRRYKPDAVFTQDPTTRYIGQVYINHPDHRAAGEAALAAVFPSARDRLTFPELAAEGLEPHKVREVYLTLTLAPDYWVDITDTLDLKIAALMEHRSQFEDPQRIVEWVRERARQVAEGQGMSYAEAFKRLTLS
ncbi:MAG: PIG-L deacetylase family protein [Anaerolineae bacterium]